MAAVVKNMPTTNSVVSAFISMGKKPRVGGIQPYKFMASDSGHMQVAGMKDGVMLGPGKLTSSIPDEYVEVGKIVDAAKIYAATALRICGHHE